MEVLEIPDKGYLGDDDAYSVCSSTYLNTSTSMVRFAEELDINHITNNSYEDKGGTESGESDLGVIVCSGDSGKSSGEPNVKHIDHKTKPSSRFSITRFPNGPMTRSDASVPR